MANVDVNTDDIIDLVNDLKSFRVDLKTFKRRISDNIPRKVIKILKENTPKDTGATSDAWKSQKSSNGFKIINERGTIVEFLIKGVGSHIIEPKNKSVLKYQVGQSVIFAKIVNHPGYSSQMDEDKILRKIRRLLDDESGKLISELIKKRMKS